MDALIAFLRAREDEREAAATAMKAVYPTPWETADRGWMARVVADGPNFHEVIRLDQTQAPDAEWLGGVVRHIELGNPDFVLADVAAKRRIITLAQAANDLEDAIEGETSHGSRARARGEQPDPRVGDSILKQLALPYADHPDYREEWRP
ncbi:hypothetical protein DMH01_03380 [Amycolatopsis sp. WAC 04182]|uniref:DUF6221 family protein n=1 Tax=Amycolatopsis sp. WAC 04182 TaxID=2203198 RepID=UPI000F78EC43|nr:DUF6221 family protein [Amycolatopsis sp. WAC 04182]RSN65431.1 hypothetical protein DMH01_03380 [Amycolatopsis sp. WAC 04182]